ERGSAEHVVHRQRIASSAIAYAEPALVVDRPHVVRLGGIHQRRAGCAPPRSAPPRTHDTSALQDRVNSAPSRQLVRKTLALEDGADLLRTPGRIGLPCPEN